MNKRLQRVKSIVQSVLFKRAEKEFGLDVFRPLFIPLTI